MRRVLFLCSLLAVHCMAAAGWSSGGVCEATQQRAADNYCKGFDGVTTFGAQQCIGATVSGSSAVANLRVYRVNSDGSVTPVTGSATAVMSGCDYMAGTEFWTPVLAAFFVAGVTIRAGKSIQKVFHRETY